MDAPQRIIIKDNHFWLSADKSVYWEEQRALIVSDLHFGKSGHFRKAGIPIPTSLYKEDLQCLLSNLMYHKAAQLIVVGDMFHSIANKELELFKRWRNDMPSVAVHLVKGNHDILSAEWYKEANIFIHNPSLLIDGIRFIHDLPLSEETHSAYYNYTFTGHIHPGIRFSGGSRQSLVFPCFYFGETHAILPAFSRFAGAVCIKSKKTDTVFAIVNNTLIKV
ncbi:ligase-associated DNA damage response endonuclease PdeM [Parasediminibacterium sp. JCM 36343]|uniref:ligase-associated DNA damage response endonuclease PdeM n=1 Tax=Parasediminibacterium sp. JCM 36343 TaxID=3374279 RepID=UPI00397C02FB